MSSGASTKISEAMDLDSGLPSLDNVTMPLKAKTPRFFGMVKGTGTFSAVGIELKREQWPDARLAVEYAAQAYATEDMDLAGAQQRASDGFKKGPDQAPSPWPVGEKRAYRFLPSGQGNFVSGTPGEFDQGAFAASLLMASQCGSCYGLLETDKGEVAAILVPNELPQTAALVLIVNEHTPDVMVVYQSRHHGHAPHLGRSVELAALNLAGRLTRATIVTDGGLCYAPRSLSSETGPAKPKKTSKKTAQPTVPADPVVSVAPVVPVVTEVAVVPSVTDVPVVPVAAEKDDEADEEVVVSASGKRTAASSTRRKAPSKRAKAADSATKKDE